MWAIAISRAPTTFWPARTCRPLLQDARPFFAIAVPAILTNIAAPAANAFFTGVMARFGDQAIAASAIIDRVTPVAFAGVFALAGAIGPVLGQNWGAQRYDRMRQTLKDALDLHDHLCRRRVAGALPRAGSADAAPSTRRRPTAEIVQFFCQLSGFIWFFIGLVFVANASFNNLGYPLLSTFFNWGRATLGMIPFAYFGAADRRAQGRPAWDRGRLRGVRHRSRHHGVLDNPAHWRGKLSRPCDSPGAGISLLRRLPCSTGSI